MVDELFQNHELPIKQDPQFVRLLLAAIERTSSIIVITNHKAEIEFVNPAFTTVTGFSSAEVMGKNPAVLKSGIHPESFYQNLWDTILAGKIWRGEFHNKRKNGELYWEFAIITPVYDEREKDITHFIAIKDDITEHKLNFEALEKSESKLRNLNETKDKFFSIIGHDLMNPMNALLGFSEMLLVAIQADDKPKSLEYASVINQSANRVMSLLQNLMTWSKVQRDSIQLNPSLTRVDQIITDVITHVADVARQKKIVFQFDLEKNIEVFIDYNMMHTILKNLIWNAVKFSSKEGKVYISARKEKMNTIFSIRDEGVGMDEQQLSHLFQLSNTFTSRGTGGEMGSGLGLVICKEFIERHQGRIWAESSPGKGSSFSFSIPESNLQP